MSNPETSKGGGADIDIFSTTQLYQSLVDLMRADGLTPDKDSLTDLFIGDDGELLPYEQALDNVLDVCEEANLGFSID